VQPLDRLGVAGAFGKDGEGEIGHVSIAFSSEVEPGSRSENASLLEAG
jgi:hypothetical protein